MACTHVIIYGHGGTDLLKYIDVNCSVRLEN